MKERYEKMKECLQQLGEGLMLEDGGMLEQREEEYPVFQKAGLEPGKVSFLNRDMAFPSRQLVSQPFEITAGPCI